MSSVEGVRGFRLEAQGGPLEVASLGPLTPGPGEVVVEVAGCGLCHTDLGFAYGGVPTRKPLPLVLGHEISGRVAAAGDDARRWINKAVVVPAVIPCGACPACIAGRPTICRDQFMPGNDGDGGFASHVLVPARGLCEVPQGLPGGTTLAMLSVVADAVTTPFEAIQRSGLRAGDLAIFIGVGGVGGFGVQIAAASGAKVVAIDVDDERLDLVSRYGASLALNARSMDLKRMKMAIRAFANESGVTGIGSRIFETSGTTAGQETAFGLLDFGAHLAIVGYTTGKVEIRMSNLMAFDATARGNWGCAPDNYPPALQLVLDGRVAIAPFIEIHRFSELPGLFEAARDHKTKLRPVVIPDETREV